MQKFKLELLNANNTLIIYEFISRGYQEGWQITTSSKDYICITCGIDMERGSGVYNGPVRLDTITCGYRFW